MINERNTPDINNNKKKNIDLFLVNIWSVPLIPEMKDSRKLGVSDHVVLISYGHLHDSMSGGKQKQKKLFWRYSHFNVSVHHFWENNNKS